MRVWEYGSTGVWEYGGGDSELISLFIHKFTHGFKR
jgi:hypothetical protein